MNLFPAASSHCTSNTVNLALFVSPGSTVCTFFTSAMGSLRTSLRQLFRRKSREFLLLSFAKARLKVMSRVSGVNMFLAMRPPVLNCHLLDVTFAPKKHFPVNFANSCLQKTHFSHPAFA
uniref:Uncharacterized protein n=1 Tax=uncultured bacterium contig00028 TaxID=1181517 RepID=A0A806K0R4_9BACT|nr:hypothetical protein [uncultured bacterium contig00028]